MRRLGRTLTALAVLSAAMLAARGGGKPDGGGRRKKGGRGNVPSNTAEAQARIEAEVDALAVGGSDSGSPQSKRETGPDGGRPLLDPPAGFKSKADFEAFRDRLNQGLREAGFGDARPILQGSATDGYSHNPSKPNTPFDGGKQPSDYDIAVASPDLMEAAEGKGVGLRSRGSRTGPLRDRELEALGLLDLRNELQQMAGGREVNFMGYRDAQAAVDRAGGPSNSLAPPYGKMSRSDG